MLLFFLEPHYLGITIDFNRLHIIHKYQNHQTSQTEKKSLPHKENTSAVLTQW